MKTRADQTEKHTFSRSRYTAFSRSRAAGRLARKAPNEAIAEFRDVAWMATAQQCKRRRRWDTGGLTANNNHAGGVEDLRNHAVVKSQRPKERGLRQQTALL